MFIFLTFVNKHSLSELTHLLVTCLVSSRAVGYYYLYCPVIYENTPIHLSNALFRLLMCILLLHFLLFLFCSFFGKQKKRKFLLGKEKKRNTPCNKRKNLMYIHR